MRRTADSIPFSSFRDILFNDSQDIGERICEQPDPHAYGDEANTTFLEWKAVSSSSAHFPRPPAIRFLSLDVYVALGWIG